MVHCGRVGGWVEGLVGWRVGECVGVLCVGAGRVETVFILLSAVVLPPPVLRRPTGRPSIASIHLTQTGLQQQQHYHRECMYRV